MGTLFLRAIGIGAALAVFVAAAAAQPRPVFTGQAELFLPDLVSTRYSEVRLALAPDGRTMLWGSTDRPGGAGGWDIWMSRYDGKRWSAPAPVAFDTAANEFDPAFGNDGTSVWFFSNRAGGLGGDDIWRVAFDPVTARFGTPGNPGVAINSAGDEWAPTPFAGDSNLLFASDGRGGHGRHDLFTSASTGGHWQMAQPLRGEVNTAADEFDAALVDDGRVLIHARSNDVDNAPIGLWMAERGADGSYRTSERLDARINVDAGFILGPMIDPTRSGMLLFSGQRPGMTRGKADIYRIRFALEPFAAVPSASSSAR